MIAYEAILDDLFFFFSYFIIGKKNHYISPKADSVYCVQCPCLCVLFPYRLNVDYAKTLIVLVFHQSINFVSSIRTLKQA